MIGAMKTVIVKAGDRATTRAVAALRKGGLVVYPTETAYGIGADATNRRAIAKVYRAKRRPRDKLLSVIVENTIIAKQYVKLDAMTLGLARKFMPGPLTLISETNW